MPSELTEDVQATVGRIANKATRLRPDDYDDAVQEGRIAAWLTDGATRNKVVAAHSAVLNFVRGRRSVTAPKGGPRRYEPRDKVVYTDEFDGTVSFPTNIEQQIDVRAAVAQLPPDLRRVLYHIYWEGRTIYEVAALLGLNRWRVARQLREGLKILHDSGMITP